MNYLGDYDAGTVLYDKFTTYQPSTGAAFALAGSPSISVYKDNSTTQSTAGCSITSSFDSVTGLNHWAVDTSADGTFYADGSFFQVVLSAGTVDGVSVAGTKLASFTLRKDSSLKPTTAGRTLDVSAGGEADANLVQISGDAQSATDLKDFADAGYDPSTNKVQGVVTVDSVTALAANSVNASALATDAVTEIQSGLATATDLATVATYIDTEVAAIKAKTDNLPSDPADASVIAAAFAVTDAKIDAIDDFVDTEVAAIKAVTDKLDDTLEDNAGTWRFTAAALAEAPSGGGGLTVQDIVNGVWDEPMIDHLDAGSTGEALNAAGAAGDPWITALPGGYTAGQAGYIVGTFLDASVQGVQDTADAIQAKTDNLPSDPADASVIAAAFAVTDGKIDTIDDFLDTEIAAIKAKTDNLPADPADASDIATSFTTVNGKLDAIQAKTDNLPVDPADQSLIIAATNALAAAISDLQDSVDAFALAAPQKNQPFSNIEFVMKLSSDHYSAATGKTVTGERSLDGGAWTAVDGTITEVGDGAYQFDALAADTNGGTVMYKFSATDCDDEFIFFKTRN